MMCAKKIQTQIQTQIPTNRTTSSTIQKRKQQSRSALALAFAVGIGTMMTMMMMMMTITMISIPSVHGWVLPPPPHQPQQHPHPQQHRSTRSFRSASSASTSTSISTSANNSCLRAASTDDEGKLGNTHQHKSLSDAERKDLVDALFKGSTNVVSQSQSQDHDDEGALDDFLDTPFFDPDAFDEDDTSFLGKFATFVKKDYELFEAIFVACFFLLLISIAKDLLRAQMVAQGIVAAGKMF